MEDSLAQPSQDKEASEDLSSPLLAQSSPLVQASEMWTAGYTGSGQVIAVLDTGVDRMHPFLSGKVVEEACYSSSANCPNGLTTQTGVGSGIHCTYAVSGCKHGTHVAGIAAGQGSSFSGVAKGANVMSVQVFSRFTGTNCGGGEDPCALSYASDMVAGLERVYALRSTRNFSSVNMSIGGSRFFSNCDTDSRKAIIDNRRSVGIATVIASGNSGFTDSMSSPGCISSAVSVGSTTKSDTLSSFSNSASFLHLLAPGSSINSSVPGGGFALMSGTSMATPHVAGAWALLKQKTPSASVSSLLSSLQSTGTPVTDTRVAGGFTKPRINIADAAGLQVPANDAFANAQSISGASAAVNGTNVGATRELGEPDHLPANLSLGENTVWYNWTAPSSGQVTIDTCTSSFDTTLAVYTGSALSTLSQVGSDDDSCDTPNGAGSRLSFNATAGTTYRIAVGGYLSANEGTFTVNLIPPPSANDNFANAQTLTGANATVTGTNVNATKESGEPNHAGNSGGKSVWYKWTPQSSGTTTIATPGSTFDTLLAVYTGDAVNSLTPVASNDDENNAGGVITSKLSFAATAGTTYRIAVDGYNENGAGAEAGNITLNLASNTNLPTIQEDNRDHTSYGNWSFYRDANFSDGYSSYANATGTKATFKFSGTSVTWKTQKLPDGGITDVYLDGTKVATFDGYSATAQYNVTGYSRSGLARGAHTLQLVVTGRKNANSSNTYTEIDRFLVGTTTRQEDYFKVNYIPWSGAQNSSASGGTYRQGVSNTLPVYFFYFRGPQVDLITAKGPTRGQATVKVIDASTTTVAKTVTLNLNASTVQWQTRQSITGLDPAKIYYLQVLSADGKQVVVDAYGAALAPQSQQPASASGAAGEESGTVIEKGRLPEQ